MIATHLHAKTLGTFKLELKLVALRKQGHIVSHMHVSFIIPQFKNHVLCAHLTKSFVYFRQVHKSR